MMKMATNVVNEKQLREAQLRALELLQKQLGLQNQKIEANIKETIIEVSISED